MLWSSFQPSSDHCQALSEFLGTYFLVLTVGFNVLGGYKAPVFSIDASLMCMIFALGTCSGAHFNPAVIIAIVAAGRDKCCPQDAGITSLPSSLPESLQSSLTAMEGKSFPLGPGKGYGWAEAATAEIMFTFLLQVLSELLGTCFLILTVSLNVLGGSKAPVFSIDASLTCMIFALGTCSGAHFNPAVTIAIVTTCLTLGARVSGRLRRSTLPRTLMMTRFTRSMSCAIFQWAFWRCVVETMWRRLLMQALSCHVFVTCFGLTALLC